MESLFGDDKDAKVVVRVENLVVSAGLKLTTDEVRSHSIYALHCALSPEVTHPHLRAVSEGAALLTEEQLGEWLMLIRDGIKPKQAALSGEQAKRLMGLTFQLLGLSNVCRSILPWIQYFFKASTSDELIGTADKFAALEVGLTISDTEKWKHRWKITPNEVAYSVEAEGLYAMEVPENVANFIGSNFEALMQSNVPPEKRSLAYARVARTIFQPNELLDRMFGPFRLPALFLPLRVGELLRNYRGIIQAAAQGSNQWELTPMEVHFIQRLQHICASGITAPRPILAVVSAHASQLERELGGRMEIERAGELLPLPYLQPLDSSAPVRLEDIAADKADLAALSLVLRYWYPGEGTLFIADGELQARAHRFLVNNKPIVGAGNRTVH